MATLALDRRILSYLWNQAHYYGGDMEDLVAEAQLGILQQEARGMPAGVNPRVVAALVGRRAMSHRRLAETRDQRRQMQCMLGMPGQRAATVAPHDIELLDVPAVLARLGSPVAEWVWQFYGQGQSWAEVAAGTGLSAQAVRARCERAIKRWFRCDRHS